MKLYKSLTASSAVKIGGCLAAIIMTHATILPITILATTLIVAEILSMVEKWN